MIMLQLLSVPARILFSEHARFKGAAIFLRVLAESTSPSINDLRKRQQAARQRKHIEAKYLRAGPSQGPSHARQSRG